ncbi:sugar phosphate isomerase/epimerase family protein [Pseudogracilibacillus auburnensis]|uniref:Sugar phosphate isomerase/epimerase n=1 Tax=Pseudogracilibacillus auburnensis TaxID=1494959 RepID=A0A2V3VY68_9BACI|nr:sugar phosphate isomerase/epimerase [Pseudogracilibacillus auburnensis]PXW85874.1 sugar phosphate isomerase/epimerase [Pseudogracilibacillus auburnensis]
MTQQFSLAYLTVVNTPPPEMTYMAARAGYDFVSLRPIYMGLPGEPNFSLAQNSQLLKETKQALKDTGLKLLDIELARIADGVDPKQYEPELEVAAELGGKHVLSSIWTDDRAYYIEQFAKLCELADQYGLTVELEFVPIASVSNLAGVVDVLSTVDKKNAGLMIDIHHFHRSHDTIDELQKVPKDWFRFVHLCDAPGVIPTDHDEMIRIVREARSYVGEGGIDVAGIVNTIPQVPYSIELPNKQQSDLLGYEEFARRCLVTAKEYFAKHPRNKEKVNC